MSVTLLYIHSVFSVKKRRPTLHKKSREYFFRHIRVHAEKNKINILRINGHDDHVHALLQLQPSQSLSEVMQKIKGESAYWANQKRIFNETLIWSRGYYARSIDPDSLPVVEHYIEGQSKHLPYYQFISEFLKEKDTHE